MQSLATTMDGTTRPVVRCNSCKLVQFVPASSKCRKCKRSLLSEPEVDEVAPATPVQELPKVTLAGLELSQRILLARKSRSLTQPELARRMNVPRTYISKLENGKCMPTLSSLFRLAEALRMRPTQLLEGEVIPGLCDRDPFITNLAEVLPQLTDIQRDAVMAHARGMAQANQTLKEHA